MAAIIPAIALTALLSSASALAADSTARTYPSPECAERDARAGECIVQDGVPPRRPPIRVKPPPGNGGEDPKPKPPREKSSFPSSDKPGQGGFRSDVRR